MKKPGRVLTKTLALNSTENKICHSCKGELSCQPYRGDGREDQLLGRSYKCEACDFHANYHITGNRFKLTLVVYRSKELLVLINYPYKYLPGQTTIANKSSNTKVIIDCVLPFPIHKDKLKEKIETYITFA